MHRRAGMAASIRKVVGEGEGYTPNVRRRQLDRELLGRRRSEDGARHGARHATPLWPLDAAYSPSFTIQLLDARSHSTVRAVRPARVLRRRCAGVSLPPQAHIDPGSGCANACGLFGTPATRDACQCGPDEEGDRDTHGRTRVAASQSACRGAGEDAQGGAEAGVEGGHDGDAA